MTEQEIPSQAEASTADVQARLQTLRERIAAACNTVGRQPGEVTLVGASKRQSIERLVAAWQAGLRVFGENRVQEARDKAPELSAEIDWHLIGPLQTNKARLAAELFSTVHSVDREKVARALEREAGRIDKSLDFFLEVNLGEESSKHGFSPVAVVAAAERLAELDHLKLVGLMAIPPFEADRQAARAWFRRLRELRDEVFALAALASRPGNLSMGMSHDFDVAVEEGATHVRVGSALFGTRA